MDAPTGTVTFLFTDIEGSTRLWDQYPDQMSCALSRHDALVRAAIERNQGHIFKTMGDAFCASFALASQAIAAATDAQIALIRETWPVECPVRARMALHTGIPEWRDQDYFGPNLNRVARLLAIGHGGQTLLSRSTSELGSDLLPPGAFLKDLGRHRLKDLQHDEPVFQLCHPDLQADFPPLRSLSRKNHNLPSHLTTFIGREKQIATVTKLLGSSRLITLTGAGGSGKTRLALQVASNMLDDFADGAWLAELAPLESGPLVAQTVAASLSVREEPNRTVIDTLIDHIREKSLLIILDNCEHLVDACADLTNRIIRSCPDVRILATSREPLGVGGEAPWPVPSLAVPSDKEIRSSGSDAVHALLEYESIQLFVERARLGQPEFQVTTSNARALAQICRRLDGIPYAIELAAARVRVLSPDQIAKRLDDRFRLLKSGARAAVPRQQTLRALIDWSYDPLSEREKRLLQRLSVFTSGWSLEAAEAVCADSDKEMNQANAADCDPLEAMDVLDALVQLVQKSLVMVDDASEDTRYWLLETMREYSRERLQARGDTETIRRHHAGYFLTLAENTEPNLSGASQVYWLRLLGREHDNFRAALEWFKTEPRGENALRLAGALHRFWAFQGYLTEGRQHLEEALALRPGREPTVGLAAALGGAGALAWTQQAFGPARKYLEESLAAWKAVGDQRRIASSLSNLGLVAVDEGNYSEALSLIEQGLEIWRALGDQQRVATNLSNLGMVAAYQGDYENARSLYSQSLAIHQQLGDLRGVAIALNNLGDLAYRQSDYATALAHYMESLPIFEELGDEAILATVLVNIGEVLYRLGDYPLARQRCRESLEILGELGELPMTILCLCILGDIARAEGAQRDAANSYSEAARLCERCGERRHLLHALGGLACSFAAAAAYPQAAMLFGAAESLSSATGLGLDSQDEEAYSLAVKSVREKLGDERFAAMCAQGASLPAAHAIEIALAETR